MLFGSPLAQRQPTEFPAPDQQRVLEQTASLEVLQECRRRPVGLAAAVAQALVELGMGVPDLLLDVELDEAYAALD